MGKQRDAKKAALARRAPPKKTADEARKRIGHLSEQGSTSESAESLEHVEGGMSAARDIKAGECLFLLDDAPKQRQFKTTRTHPSGVDADRLPPFHDTLSGQMIDMGKQRDAKNAALAQRAPAKKPAEGNFLFPNFPDGIDVKEAYQDLYLDDLRLALAIIGYGSVQNPSRESVERVERVLGDLRAARDIKAGERDKVDKVPKQRQRKTTLPHPSGVDADHLPSDRFRDLMEETLAQGSKAKVLIDRMVEIKADYFEYLKNGGEAVPEHVLCNHPRARQVREEIAVAREMSVVGKRFQSLFDQFCAMNATEKKDGRVFLTTEQKEKAEKVQSYQDYFRRVWTNIHNTDAEIAKMEKARKG